MKLFLKRFLILMFFLTSSSYALADQITTTDVSNNVNKVKSKAKKYLINREDAKRRKDFISEEKKGTSFFVRIRDQDDVNLELIYDDHRKTVTEAVLRDKKGNQKFYFYHENGTLSQYMEGVNEEVNGLQLQFFPNSTLKYYGEFKDGFFCGREIFWDVNGKMLKSRINDCTRKFTLSE